MISNIFTESDATALEQQVYQKFLEKQQQVFNWISGELTGGSAVRL